MSKGTKQQDIRPQVSQQVLFERNFSKMFVELSEGTVSKAILFQSGYPFKASETTLPQYPTFVDIQDQQVNFEQLELPVSTTKDPKTGLIPQVEVHNSFGVSNFKPYVLKKYQKLYLNLSQKEEFQFLFQYFVNDGAAYYETRFKDVIQAGMLWMTDDNIACFIAIPRFQSITILESACDYFCKAYINAIKGKTFEMVKEEEAIMNQIPVLEEMFDTEQGEMNIQAKEPEDDEIQFFHAMNNFSFDDTLNQDEKNKQAQAQAEAVVLATMNLTRYHVKELPPKLKDLADSLLYAVTHFDATLQKSLTEDDKVTRDMIYDTLIALQIDYPELYQVLQDGIIAEFEMCEGSNIYVANITLGKQPTGDQRTAMRDLQKDAFRKVEEIVKEQVKKTAIEQTPLGWERSAVQWMQQNLSIIDGKGNIIEKNYGYEYRTEAEQKTDMQWYEEQKLRWEKNPKEVKPTEPPKANVKLVNYDLKDNAQVKVQGFAPCPDLEEEPNFDADKNSKTNKQQVRVDFYKKKFIRNLGYNTPFSPIYNRCGSCFAVVQFFRLICAVLEIEAVSVDCICIGDYGINQFLKVKIGEDWVCLDVYSCIKKMDYRDFNLDDSSFNLTHEPIGDQVDDSKFFYPRSATMKLSYYSIMNTLITSMNLDQALELLSRAETKALEDSRTRTLPFCFMCTAEQQKKVLGQLLQVDDQVGREKERTVHCHKYRVIEGSEDPVIGPAGVQINGYCVVEFYFQTWSGLDVDAEMK